MSDRTTPPTTTHGWAVWECDRCGAVKAYPAPPVGPWKPTCGRHRVSAPMTALVVQRRHRTGPLTTDERALIRYAERHAWDADLTVKLRRHVEARGLQPSPHSTPEDLIDCLEGLAR